MLETDYLSSNLALQFTSRVIRQATWTSLVSLPENGDPVLHRYSKGWNE